MILCTEPKFISTILYLKQLNLSTPICTYILYNVFGFFFWGGGHGDFVEEDGTWLMIGSNNRFSPCCHVETSCIGNSNIFEASCSVRRKSPIGSGNVIAPLVQIMMMEQANDDETLLENTVIYNLGDNRHPQFRQEQDNDIIQSNTLENKRLLKHAQIVLKEHHTLMTF